MVGVFLHGCVLWLLVWLGDQGFQHGGHVGCSVGVDIFALGQGLFDGHEVQGCIRAVGGDDSAVAVVKDAEFRVRCRGGLRSGHNPWTGLRSGV